VNGDGILDDAARQGSVLLDDLARAYFER